MSEVSPSFAAYLAISPFAFLLAGLLWMAIFSALIVILPEMLAMTLAIAVMLGHLNGAFTWLTYRFESYQASNALFLLTAFLIVIAFRKGRSDTGRAALDWSQSSLPAWSRWVLVVVLLLLPIWWFLIPH